MKAEITFQNKDIHLYGTLITPNTEAPHPVVIAAHTSHAATRDYCVYQHLASILPECGVAVFLFDRRGSGDSTGDFETATFYDLAADIQAAMNNLKSRRDIDSKKIGLWGMSQGGWIAPLAASISADVAFVIAVSAVGVSPAEQMDYSAVFALNEMGFSEQVIRQMLELRGMVNAYYRGNANYSSVREKLDLFRNEKWFSQAYLDDLLPQDPTITKWYQEMDFDPMPIIQKINVPVLLLYGERDPWVPITRSIKRWKEFGQDLTIHQIRDANHFMISISYSGIQGDNGPIVEEYSTILTGWINQQLS
ncbi:MAG: alpha/beta hydrolase [Anaerolineales bacterium]|nr:alpha/beta hydrolase [Anaerolineales bacterium]